MRPEIETLDIPPDARADIARTVDMLVAGYPENVLRVILFGSYANHTWQPDSDIDLAVVLRALPPPGERREYKRIVDLERDIDLVFLTGQQLAGDDLLYREIREKGVIVYEQL